LKALESVERNEELEIAIGNVFLQKKQPEQAIQYYKNALRINPFNERARWNWEVAIKMQSGSQSPPPPPSPPSITPNQIPEESRALLDYFDQMEKEDRKQENKKNANESTFAW
jgi:tetratricopeptide (TPR) repeat protein